MTENPPAALEDLIAEEALTSRQLQSLTGRSQPWVSARLRSLGDRVVRIPSGRTVRYALARPAFGSDDLIPVWTVDPYGNTTRTLNLRPLAKGRFAVELAPGMSRLWLGDAGNGQYDDLPWFLSDMRPQGFIGRAIASSLLARGAQVPADPRDWSAEHVGRYLVANGDDLPGNLQVGHQAGLRVRRLPMARVQADYSDLADAALQGEAPGSSAGGEQPKFAVYSKERSAHVIVKFSPGGHDTVANRWRDVLVTEHEASRALRDAGIPAGETQLVRECDRLFLESDRFDRRGKHGRLSMFSLQSVDTEFVGLGVDWRGSMRALLERGLVSKEHVHDVDILQAFGRCIGNTDMHLGNVSVGIDGDMFRLSPVYDMCSMCLAPTQDQLMPIDQLRALHDILLPELNSEAEALLRALCEAFWIGVAKNVHSSEELATFAQSRARLTSREGLAGFSR